MISKIFTLGPSGTNLEKASFEYLLRIKSEGRVFLYPTLEEAVEKMDYDEHSALLACIVYPNLHHLVFRNLDKLRLLECFMADTYAMVLAAKINAFPKSVCTHPAPVDLLPPSITDRFFVNSNSQAASDCATGKFDGCITTHTCAQQNNLHVIVDYGSIPMGFSVHIPIIQKRNTGTSLSSANRVD
jgi:hypothetical protein